MEELGFTEVESYGMSGNLLFNVKGKDKKQLERRIHYYPVRDARGRADGFAAHQDHRPGFIPFKHTVPHPLAHSIERRTFLQLDFASPHPVLRGRTIYFVHPAHLRRKRGSFDFEGALGVLGTARSARVVRQILERMTK